MANSNPKLIRYIRETADRLEGGADYQWGHQGQCNCGHIVQTITELSPSEIYHRVIQTTGEWSEFANDYCMGTNLEIEEILDTLNYQGLSREDMRNLEYLSDESILSKLPGGKRYLEKNKREDAILYMRTWADVLEEKDIPKKELVTV
jgi:hypothetical protein